MSASIYLLLGNSLEQTLKAMFLKYGGDPTKLISPIGHDLQKCLDRANEAGFRSEVNELPALVGFLRDAHKNHYFRYLGEGSIKLPDLLPSLLILEAHAKQVAKLMWLEEC